MVKAVNGMTEEADMIFKSVFLLIISFTFCCVATVFQVMEYDAAIVSLIVVFLGSYSWYTYCLRIYNRFQVSIHIK
jgi:hypothetical protein